MAENDKFETLGDAYAKYPQSTLVMRKQYVDELNARKKKCPYCHPYKEHLIEGNNGFCCVTKDAELIAFNNADGVGAAKIKINYCPMCGRKLKE